MCECLGNVQMFGKCADVWEMCGCLGNVRMCKCANVQMLGKCADVWEMCKCLGNVWMFGKCVDVLMCLR